MGHFLWYLGTCPSPDRSRKFPTFRIGHWSILTGICIQPGGYQQLVPSGYVKIAMENGHRNSEFSH
jgi:hypothetical protein